MTPYIKLLSTLSLLTLLAVTHVTAQDYNFPEFAGDYKPLGLRGDDPNWHEKITGAEINENVNFKTLHVDANAQSKGTGSKQSPYRSLQGALEKAMDKTIKGDAVKILLQPGVYRETASLSAGGDGLLVIEGVDKASTIITGSDDWSDADLWKSKQGIYRAKWDYEWGDYMQSSKAGDEGSIYLKAKATDDGGVELEWKSDIGERFNVYRRGVRNLEGEDAALIKLLENTTQTSYKDSTTKNSLTWTDYVYEFYVTVAKPGGAESGSSNRIVVTTGTRSSASRPNYLGRRRELVFVDGALMQQVESLKEMTPGTFFVDEGYPGVNDGFLYLSPPTGKVPGSALIEVATRPAALDGSLLTIKNKTNLVIRNLTFKHCATRLWNTAALSIHQCDNALIENIDASWNNGRGLATWKNKNLTIRDAKFNYNGGTGMGGWAEHNSIVENVEAGHNTWRGDWGDIHGWFFGGIKTGFGLRGAVFRNLHMHNNYSQGLWFDYNNKFVYVDGLISHHNKENGIFIEASHGPFVLTNSRIIKNEDYGIHLANTPYSTFTNNVTYGNGKVEFDILDWVGRKAKDSDVGEEKTVNQHHVKMFNNAFISKHPLVPVYKGPSTEFIYKTLTADKNLWYHPDPDAAFNISDLGYNFDVWQRITGQDMRSVFQDPRFKDIENLNYSVHADSPLRTRNEWPKRRDAGKTGMDVLVQEAVKAVERAWAVPYPRLESGRTPEPIDISSLVNRPLRGKDAWIGMDLVHLNKASFKAYGIPFLLGEHSKDTLGGIALRSDIMKQTGTNKLPEQVDIPINGKYEALYILHGSGYIGSHDPIGTYSIVYSDGSEETIDIVPLGPAGKDTDIMKILVKESNIQDWWPSNYHFSNDSTRALRSLNPNDPSAPPAYPYVVEIENPHPQKSIKAFRMAIKDPNGKPSMMLFAISGLPL